jgi:hypothetical protein
VAADGYLTWQEDRMFKRTVVTLIVLALAVPAYWMSHRTRWAEESISWDAVSVSSDGRVLTFRAATSGMCDEPGHVDLDGRLEAGARVVATLYLKHPTNRPCKMAAIAPGIPVITWLPHALPEGVTFVDGGPGPGAGVAPCDPPIERTPRHGDPLPAPGMSARC